MRPGCLKGRKKENLWRASHPPIVDKYICAVSTHIQKTMDNLLKYVDPSALTNIEVYFPL